MDLPDHKKIAYMPHTEYRLVSAMYGLVCDGITYCMYKNHFDSLSGSFKGTSNHIWFIHTVNAYYDLAISNWCKIFGSYSEPTHYNKLIETQALKAKLLEVELVLTGADQLRAYILDNAGLKPDEYSAYHELTKDYRNRNLVHREHSPDEIKDGDLYFPKLDIAQNIFISLVLLLINLAKKFPEVGGDEVNSYKFLYDDFSEKAQIFSLIEKSFPRFNLNGC